MTFTRSRHQNDHSEGMVARAIEQQTARLPSDLFLWAAGGSIASPGAPGGARTSTTT